MEAALSALVGDGDPALLQGGGEGQGASSKRKRERAALSRAWHKQKAQVEVRLSRGLLQLEQQEQHRHVYKYRCRMFQLNREELLDRREEELLHEVCAPCPPPPLPRGVCRPLRREPRG
jgi:hypothetical protein